MIQLEFEITTLEANMRREGLWWTLYLGHLQPIQLNSNPRSRNEYDDTKNQECHSIEGQQSGKTMLRWPTDSLNPTQGSKAKE
ncbi:hypothetical protein H5410_015150 [Solanum commersonii]|uniref:Uncharacterized protein n=1 Tax=Solanum commersonii TaxID=4109 RepID=A0A9J5ZSX1_SOLCO|nr:hypothetical protein H5410_015150 [Solanum commersonii]